MTHSNYINFAKEYIQGLLNISVVLLPNTKEALSSYFLSNVPPFFQPEQAQMLANKLVFEYPEQAISHLTDQFGIHYMVLPFQSECIIVGPYITEPTSQKQCETILKKNQISTLHSIAFHLFYQSLIVCLNSKVQIACTILMKQLFHTLEEPCINDYVLKETDSEISESALLEENKAITKELIEQRYEYEKRFLLDVYNGNRVDALKHYEEFNKATLTLMRADTPLRSKKNLCFTLNTRLRTAAQKAKVHPLYLDNISGNFARLAENCKNLDELNELKTIMISAYCRLVQQHSLRDYSPTVRNAIIYIKHHLEEPINLDLLAKHCNVSPTYLSKLFNSEVGESIPNYINHRKADYAAKLLRTTDYPIKTICSQIGLLDTNYFTKIFKKYYAMPPTQYRNHPNNEID